MYVPTGVTASEVLGPYGVFRRVDGAQVHLLGDRAGPVPCQGSKVPLLAESAYPYADPSGLADVLVVPGGLGIRGLVTDRAILDWLRRAAATAPWTIGISTGSVLLSAAGVLDGREATTHWLATDLLEQQGACSVPERLVHSGTVVTATGAVAGIEAALYVVARLRSGTEADVIRSQLDAETTGRLAANKAVGADALAELVGVGPTPLDEPRRRRARPRRRRPRRPSWSPRAGRIRTGRPAPR